MKKLVSLVLLFQLFLVNILNAQSGSDFLREIGKIYVVVIVMALVFIGVVFFLIYIDRRLTKLEDQIK